MFNPEIIFQRTQTGRDEIQQKSHGLTQSERLVLIMVDGVSNYKEVRAKLPVLTAERFDRALSNLQKKDLILEVFLPVDGQPAEILERTVIDRFLQQDPLDPVTIIVRDPEEELGALGQAFTPESASASKPDIHPEFTTPSDSSPADLNTGPALDEHHSELADTLGQEVRALKADRPPRRENTERSRSKRQGESNQRGKNTSHSSIHWGYLLIAIGLAFIAGYFLAKLGN